MNAAQILMAADDYEENGRWGRCAECPEPDFETPKGQPPRPHGPSHCQNTDRYDHQLGKPSLLRACGIAVINMHKQGRAAEAVTVLSVRQRVRGMP